MGASSDSREDIDSRRSSAADVDSDDPEALDAGTRAVSMIQFAPRRMSMSWR